MLSLKIVLNTPSFPFNPKKEYKTYQFLWKGKDRVHCYHTAENRYNTSLQCKADHVKQLFSSRNKNKHLLNTCQVAGVN